MLEPLLERTVFEDMPANLAAIKQRVEALEVRAAVQAVQGAASSLAQLSCTAAARCCTLLPCWLRLTLPIPLASAQAEREISVLEEAGEASAAAVLRRRLERPSLAEMSDSFALLAASWSGALARTGCCRRGQ